MSEILYTVALDETGELVKASDSEKNCSYFCPICNAQLILRKSGNVGKYAKRPHFAHRTLTPNCTPETALHYSFKNLLAKKIDDKLLENTPLHFKWECKYCGKPHAGNLLKKITTVKLEYSLVDCKPDIALLDKNNKVFAVIEVVVTHKPEEKVIEYYEKNNIILLQVHLTSDEDLEQIDRIIANPTIVATCYNPKCSKCGNYKETKIMTIIDGQCLKCDSNMKVAYISYLNQSLIDGPSNLYPSDFSPTEKSFATEKGVILSEKYSKTAHRKVVANCCPNCDEFVGDNYMFSAYISIASYRKLPFQEFNVGFFCKYCED